MKAAPTMKRGVAAEMTTTTACVEASKSKLRQCGPWYMSVAGETHDAREDARQEVHENWCRLLVNVGDVLCDSTGAKMYQRDRHIAVR